MSKPLQLPAMAQGDLEYMLHLLNMEGARLNLHICTCKDSQLDTLLLEMQTQTRLREALAQALARAIEEGGSHE
jgi:hypothetical protein